ncbi:adenine phosphoribosyltransferase [Salmo salar]|uniref:Adenine phosphoribosyltransferase n=1 Tax=Salmo salar TaxID=8030 RepID=A0A1S3KTP9_SALSA|nr:adenine phosphoribosyltransferase [Salmo salar]|eukprot:XP_013982086.1 PREDICTED: adenine phosphoribosyltransferase-like [Salmo salar]
MALHTREAKLDLVTKSIKHFPDFPSKGILFRDICPILKDPGALTAVIDLFEEHVRQTHPQVELIVGLDARGFLFGPLLAQRLGVGFVLVRKKGKLPGPTVSVAYKLEYGEAAVEVQEDAVAPGEKVLLIDDLLATGGTMYAACELMKKQNAEVMGCMVVIELKELNGVEKLKPNTLFSLVQY